MCRQVHYLAGLKVNGEPIYNNMTDKCRTYGAQNPFPCISTNISLRWSDLSMYKDMGTRQVLNERLIGLAIISRVHGNYPSKNLTLHLPYLKSKIYFYPQWVSAFNP